ncbi:T9SS type A sorting domain-containing protein, partial [Candidatus Dependentiae bacterium]|nr:T9SS type A sorting domain-containing protein [Candidatus Dependentiae bacterium]
YGINISDSGTNNNRVLGNYIGTDVNGTNDLGNSSCGIIIQTGAKSNTIGGTISGARNIISGNDSTGVYITSNNTDNNVVLGNYIGTDVTGAIDLGNSWDGIRVGNGAEFNFIGGEISGSGNIISGNDMSGVLIYNSGTANNFVFGNYIGTDVNGTSNLGNLSKGIYIFNSAQSNTIGGTISGQANIIAFNGDGGVVIAGNSSDYNRISGNSIFSNTGLGIDLDENGVSPNDVGDVDTGPNEGMNFPTIFIQQSGINSYSISGTSASSIDVEIYIVNNSTASVTADPTGYGEGYEYLSSTTTDVSGDFLVEGQVLPSDCILTGIVIDGDGNTSEFGPNSYITPNTLSVTITNSAPATIMQDETDVLLANLDLSADLDNVVWTDLQVTGTGTGIDTDIIAIKVYADNGDLEFSSTTDTEIGTGTFTGGVADIDITNQSVTSTSSVYFVTVDVSGATEIIGNTCSISISNTTNFTICAPDTVATFTPYNSGTITFTDNPDLVVVTPNDLATGSTRAGTEDLIFEVLSIATQHETATLTALDIDLIGTGDDNDISTVKVYLDDGDGDFSPADDSIIGTGTFTIKSASIDIADQELSETAKIYYIVMDISEDAVNDHTIGIRCEDNSYFSITAPDTISNSEFPFESNLTTIMNYADTLDNMKVYPNPWKTGCGVEYISFVELTENVKIRIFNISGELVIETDADNQPKWFWHLKNQDGNRIASGVYLYVITNDQGEKKKGKIAVIK